MDLLDSSRLQRDLEGLLLSLDSMSSQVIWLNTLFLWLESKGLVLRVM